MKRFFRFPLVIIVAFAAITSCTDFREEEIPISFGVDVNEMVFASSPSTRSLTISSGTKWDISSMPSWISLGAISQSGHSPYEWTASFSATENDEYYREGKIMIKAGSDATEISVTQEGKKGKYIAVESVSLSPTEMALTVGENASLTYSISPASASIKDVTWKSSAPSIATISSSGRVDAVAEGTAKITVTTNDGNKTATCTVTVNAKVIPVTGVSLDKSTLSMTVGDTQTLTATVTPSNATNKSVTWKSSSPLVATIGTNSGRVEAIAEGTTTITVTTNDGNKTATCTVTVNSAWSGEGSENGHDYVDLGLPSGLMWATCNVGASRPENYGDYFAWGETSTKSEFSWTNYKYRTSGSHESDVKFSKYNSDSNYGTVDKKNTLDLSDDAARVNWGGRWRTPTNSEIQELRANCTYSWTTLSGISGYKLTSKNNGKSIFLPAAGRWFESLLDYVGEKGYYWSSSLYSGNVYPFYARFLLFDSSVFTDNYHYRCAGRSVRPVFDLASVPVTGVSLNKTSLSMTEGDTYTLSATVSPSNATDKSVTWSSNNTFVATVSSSGMVTAKAVGSAAITVTTIDGGKTAICNVTVTSSKVTPEAIDLGLPSGVKWASFNLGATSPTEYGDYYAWGETETYYSSLNPMTWKNGKESGYLWSSYKWGDGASFTKYNTDSSLGVVDNKTTLDLEDDVARVRLGGTWRMPTYEEYRELIENCSFKWGYLDSVRGMFFTSTINGKQVFFPAAGCYHGTGLNAETIRCRYWSSSLNPDSPSHAWYLYCDSSEVNMNNNSETYFRFGGLSIRPVSK